MERKTTYDLNGVSVSIGITKEFGKSVNVIDSPYNAKGDRFTNDRPAIQQAIDDVHAAGGGTVILPGGHTYLTGDLEIKSNVTIEICTGALLKQSMNPEHYAHKPELGAEFSTGLIWDGKYHANYPMIYGSNGTSNVRITGGGSMEQDYTTREDDDNIFMSFIGFFGVNDFEISNIQLRHCHGYYIAFRNSKGGLVKGVTVSDPERGCPDGWGTDGISLMNCQDIRITGCNIVTDDDQIYIWTSYMDPRGRTWWNSNDPRPTMNIEVDHNFGSMIHRMQGEWCHGFGILPWGGTCPDFSKLLIRNIYVHDNVFYAPHPIGSIGADVYHKTDELPPVSNVRLSNNVLHPTGDVRGIWLDTLTIDNLTIE